MKKLLGLLSVLVVVSSCSPKSSDKAYIKPFVPDEKVNEEAATEIYDPRIDILFVVDNSYSMYDHQRNVASNINLFLAEFLVNNTLDYQVGVITTDDPLLKRTGGFNIVDKSTPNAAQVLAQNLMVGIDGSGTEAVFTPAEEALSAPLVNGANMGFLRQGAFLAIIPITDAEDQSYRQTPTGFYNFLLQLKNSDPRKVLAYGAIIPTNTKYRNCARDGGYETPVKIEEFLQMVSNAPNNVMELCSKDFGKELAALSRALVKNVTEAIYLNRVPVVETLKVTFGTQVIPKAYKTGWVYDSKRNAILLGEEIKWEKQPKGTKLRVDFTPAEY